MIIAIDDCGDGVDGATTGSDSLLGVLIETKNLSICFFKSQIQTFVSSILLNYHVMNLHTIEIWNEEVTYPKKNEHYREEEKTSNLLWIMNVRRHYQVSSKVKPR